MLLPALNNAREKAKQASCQNQLKQLTLAQLMYADDWGERLAPSYTAKPGVNIWNRIIREYHNSVDIERCPSATEIPDGGLSYGMNYYYLTYRYPGHATTSGYGYWGVNLSQLRQPTETIMIGDSGSHNLPAGNVFMAYVINWYRRPGNYFVYLRHVRKGNLSYVDGHVESQSEGYTTNIHWFNSFPK